MLERVAQERYPRLVAHGMLLTGTQAEAEDLVQDALVSTFAGRARFATVEQAEAYVRRAVVSRFIDQGRRRTAERRALVRVAGQPVVVAAAPSSGLAPEVERALGRLSPRERACVVLRHVEDLSVRETARLLRLSEGAVKRYVSDGVASLNAALGTAAGTAAHDGAEAVPVRRVSARGARPDGQADGQADGRTDAGPDGRTKEVRRDA
jgi:RNA polymerase sigma factor (sigma-70 family)